MLIHKKIREEVNKILWQQFYFNSLTIQQIEAKLKTIGIQQMFLDHLAIIDLPGPYSGMGQLNKLFKTIGYLDQGKDYLPDKHNDFAWMAAVDNDEKIAEEALPQIVIADFRLEELPMEVKMIIEKYAQFSASFSIENIFSSITEDEKTLTYLSSQITQYLRRDWPLPTTKEFYTVHEFNELLAWVLIFGRQPNHFTLSVHLLKYFNNLEHFLDFIQQDIDLQFNDEGGKIKGGKQDGIAQASTLGVEQIIALEDGNISIPSSFIEFVWRYAREADSAPILWKDYFTGFVARNANKVIESLYLMD